MQAPVPNQNVVPSMPTDKAAPSTDQNMQKFLDFLGKAEGADYNVIVGGGKFNDFSRHPGVIGLRTKEGPSTAAGKYQITQTTYNDIAPRLGIKDFSPQSQDRIAIELIRRKGAFDDIQKGDFRSAIDKLGATWASLPSSPYTQPKRSWDFVQNTLGVPIDTPTQRTQTAGRTQKATAGASPSAKKPAQFASLDALPANYRTALALNFLADSDPEDEVMSKALEVLRATQEDAAGGKTPGGDMLQKYVKGQEGVDPFQFLQREEEPEPRLRYSRMRRMKHGGVVHRKDGSPPQGERAVPSMAEVPVLGPDGRVVLPPPEPEPEFTLPQKLMGGLEAGASIVSGAVTAPIAAATGLLRGKNIREADVEAGKVMEAGTFMPRGEAGRKYLQDFGRFMQENKLDALLPQAQLMNVRVAPGAAKYLGEQAKGKVEEAVMPGLREKAGNPNLTPEQVYDAMLGKPSEVLAGAGASYATRPLGAYGEVKGDVQQAKQRIEDYAFDAALQSQDFVNNLDLELATNARRLKEAGAKLEKMQNMTLGQLNELEAREPNVVTNTTRRVEELEGQKTALEVRLAQERDRQAIFNNFGPQIKAISDKATDYFSTSFGTTKDPLYKAFVEGRWTPNHMMDQANYLDRELPLSISDLLRAELNAGEDLNINSVRRLAQEGSPGVQEQAKIALSTLYDNMADQTGNLVSPYTDLGLLMNPEARKIAIPAFQDMAETISRKFKDATSMDEVIKALEADAKGDKKLLDKVANDVLWRLEGSSERQAAKRSLLELEDFKSLAERSPNDLIFRSARKYLMEQKRDKRLEGDDYYGYGEDPALSLENLDKAITEVYLPTLKHYYETQTDPVAGKVGTTADPRSVAITKTLYSLLGTPEMKKKSLQDIEADIRRFNSENPHSNSFRIDPDSLSPEQQMVYYAKDFNRTVMPDVYETFYNNVIEQQGGVTSKTRVGIDLQFKRTLAPAADDEAGDPFRTGTPKISVIDTLNNLVQGDPQLAESVKRGMPVFRLDSNVLWDADYSPFDMADIAEYAASLSPTELRNKSFADLAVGSQSIWSNLDTPKTILNRMEKRRPTTPEQKLLGITRVKSNIPITNVDRLGSGNIPGWYEITSAEGLKAEGLMAEHCIKQPSYFNEFYNGGSKFFTLRDSMGHPRLTIQMINDSSDPRPGTPADQLPGNNFTTVAQIKGNHNSPDAEMLQEEVNDFFRYYMKSNQIPRLKITEDSDYLTPALRGEEPL